MIRDRNSEIYINCYNASYLREKRRKNVHDLNQIRKGKYMMEKCLDFTDDYNYN